MIYGVLDSRDRQGGQVLPQLDGGLSAAERYAAGPVALSWVQSPVRLLGGGLAVAADRSAALVWEGRISNEKQLREDHSDLRRSSTVAELLLASWLRHGPDAPTRWRGKFAVAVWDARTGKLRLIRDRIGIEQLFYYVGSGVSAFSSSASALLRTHGATTRLCHESLKTFLLLCYNPFEATFFDGVKKVEPGSIMSMGEGSVEAAPYWRLNHAEADNSRSATEHAAHLRELMAESVAAQLGGSNEIGAFLSGGMDSSSVVSLMSRSVTGFHAYSFRCLGKSFDESAYAKLVSDRCGGIYEEVDFPAESAARIQEMVRFMEEPLCDSGIEVASYLLGEAAGRQVAYILTGDGGDELFGGHPVYIADKVARYADALPRGLMSPPMALLRRLPDSDQKKNLLVMAKRFAESWEQGAALGSHRWRLYYSTDSLRALCTGDLWNIFSKFDLPARLASTHDPSIHGDTLARSLSSDWRTVVRFAVRRQDMARAWGVEPRFPFYESALVEYAARIPSRLKIRGWADSKHIQHQAMISVVPDEILNRKDKLGHSVPLKNWIRDSPVVRDFIRSVLTPSAVAARGLFQPAAVERMIEEHLTRRANHAHRLWALVTLELWMQRNFS